MLLSQYFEQTVNRLMVDRRLRTDAERSVSAEAERTFRRQMGVIAGATGLFFHFSSLWTDEFMVRDEAARAWLMSVHLGAIVAAGVAALIYWFWPKLFSGWIVAGTLVNAAIYAAVGYSECLAQRVPPTEPLLGFLAISVVTVAICPAAGVGAAIVVGLLNVLGDAMVFAGTHDVWVTVRWGSVELLSTTGGLLIQRFMTVQTTLTARASLEAMLKIAPAPIVAHAVVNKEPLETAFKPQLRPCACISVTWTDYESLAYKQGDARLAELLDEYYQLVDQLLETTVTDGAYYVDVMVGEMFIVIFDPPEQPGSRSVSEAFAFARWLFDLRRECTDQVLRRARIDIGLASGDALVGIMGPSQHRKTTGLGELPGRAARLKGAAQLLTRARGSADRIVLDKPSAMRLGGGMQRFTVPVGQRIKDLDEAALHFWERAE